MLIEKPLFTVPVLMLVVEMPDVIDVVEFATYDVARPIWIGAGWLFSVVTVADVTVVTLP